MGEKEKTDSLVRQLYQALLSLQTEEDCRAFCKDLFTAQELQTFSRRLETARLLRMGETYDAVRQQVDVSSATITRINTCLQYGAGGYEGVLDRLKQIKGTR